MTNEASGSAHHQPKGALSRATRLPRHVFLCTPLRNSIGKVKPLYDFAYVVLLKLYNRVDHALND